MSPRVLKTKFPCVDCGKATGVGRLSEGASATCDQCLAHLRAMNLIGWADEAANRAYSEVNGQVEDALPLVIGCLKAAEERLNAGSRCLAALKVAKPNETQRLVRSARGRLRWTLSLLQNLESHFEDAIAEAKTGRELEAIAGGGDVPSAEIPPPRLELISGGRVARGTPLKDAKP